MTETVGTDLTLVVQADGNNNVRLALPVSALRAAGLASSDYQAVIGTSSQPDHVEVTVGAAGARYLADLAGLPTDPQVWPDEVSGIAHVVAEAVPYAAARIDDERRKGQRRRVAIYSGDLARSQGEPLEENHRRYGGSSSPSCADPRVYDRLAPRADRV